MYGKPMQHIIFKGQRRQSVLKTWGSWSGFENWGSWVLKVQQTEAHSTGFRLSSPEFLFNIHKSLYKF